MSNLYCRFWTRLNNCQLASDRSVSVIWPWQIPETGSTPGN
ncbi:hypothetical protein [Nostoc sp. JL33]|nr:hypothetical protein [Nostoc sp. JL33]